MTTPTPSQELHIAAARMRLLTGPSAEPIARLLEEHASDLDLRPDGRPRTLLDETALDAARSINDHYAAGGTA
ncbi:hypothetical protein [Streptomyces collinus]